jgi:hypothetical protein
MQGRRGVEKRFADKSVLGNTKVRETAALRPRLQAGGDHAVLGISKIFSVTRAYATS